MSRNSIFLYKMYLFCSCWCTLLCYTKYAQICFFFSFFLSLGLFCFLPYSYLGWARHGQYRIYHPIYIIMADLNILSVNCQGICLLPNRTDVLNYLKGKGCQIYCLQDTHLSPGVDEMFVRSRWNSDCYFSSDKSNARGIAILFAKNFEYKVHKSISDPNGNFLLLGLTVHNNRFTLASIYGPNIDNPGFFQTVSEKIAELDNNSVVWCGDFNFVLNPKLDYKNYKTINNKNAREKLLEIMSERHLIDPYRDAHPEL